MALNSTWVRVMKDPSVVCTVRVPPTAAVRSNVTDSGGKQEIAVEIHCTERQCFCCGRDFRVREHRGRQREIRDKATVVECCSGVACFHRQQKFSEKRPQGSISGQCCKRRCCRVTEVPRRRSRKQRRRGKLDAAAELS